VLICQECRAGFTCESGILDHQSHYQALHKVDPEINEHDGAEWGVGFVEVGQTYVWEPQHPTAREVMKVTRIVDNGEEVWVFTVGDRDPKEYGNELGRFADAVWPGTEMSSEQRVRIVLAERELGLEDKTPLHDGLADALRDGLGGHHRYKTRDDMELLIISILETRQLKKMIATLLDRQPAE